ncbi:multisubstrate pseudouridine synthase 7 [Mercurialis annua]|uniref:multisubstrate pseudouridine synthase 7 n=1 Tax=Mercurialis annua TaxID=3986 RepID=UPI00215FE080|nr:multisubstrate pseudouridine synthase 7 [Mercurialis annua]
MMCHCTTSFRYFSVLKPYYPPSPSTYRTTTTTATLTGDYSFNSPMTTIDESDVGISCYISKLPGFRGILKQRYSDFIVNEVGTDGNVVHLTSLHVSPEVLKIEEEKEIDVTNQISGDKNYADEIEAFRLIAGDDDTQRLEAFITEFNEDNSKNMSPIVLSPDSDKAHRTAMHNFFKEKLKFLVTDTVDGPDAMSKCIRVRLNSGGHSNGGGRNSKKRKDRNDNQAFDSRGSNHWPEDLGKFLRFHLYKENKDTQEALGIIGKMLGLQPRAFGFSGTKDKRAVTTQRVTLFKQRASRLAALNDRLIGIKVGDFCHVKEELLLGQLLGNRFTITLRGVVADSEDTIKGSADSLGRNGFINYFGLQRFGSGSVPTHLIGATLLRGEWKSVVNMILDPREGERYDVRKIREYYKESGDIDGTLRQLPRYLNAERAVLQCLKKCPGNYLQALKAIPRTLRMMYVHSYQSYLWNHAASVRVQKYGNGQVVVGDLVYCKGDDTESEVLGVNSECEDGGGEDIYECSTSDETSGINPPERKNDLVKAVTAEDISTGSYTINDVILPMPGSRVSYPTNDIAEVYHDLAKKDSINLAESVHSVKEFSITSMTGSYRRVFQKPMDFEWEIMSYTDSNTPLAETDLEKIAKANSVELIKEEKTKINEEITPIDCTKQPMSSENNLCRSAEHDEGERVGAAQVEPVCVSNSQGSETALKLSFTLPSSCYATMAIRELLKSSTSVAFHKTLNQ